MPQILHADLLSAKFPYNYSELSSTVVINRGLESHRNAPSGFHGAEAVQSEGIPQAYFMQNVMPSSRGFTSVAYTQMLASFPGAEVVLEAFEIRGAPAGLALYAITETKQFIFDANVGAWAELTTPTYDPGGTTIAHVKGITYIFILGSGLYTYDFINKVLKLETAIGLDVGEIKGIFSAGAVLGAWTADLRILWSSIFDPLDFDPLKGLSTGAGSTSVLAISSEIVSVLALGQDFIVYTATNAVSGRQTGNVQFPFTFAEVVGSCGIAHAYHVAHNSNAGLHIAYSASGFQQIGVQQAEFIWPELSEGIHRGIRVTLDSLLLQPKFEYTLGVDVRLQFCSNRYLAVSLRDRNISTVNTAYTEAHIFDSQLNRWGRIVAPHACVIEHTLQVVEGVYTYDQLEADYINYSALDTIPVPPLSYRQLDSAPIPVTAVPGANFGLVGTHGSVHVMAPSQTAEFRGDNVGIDSAMPRIFLGKYKVVREAGVVLQGIRVNKLIAAGIVAHGHGYDGSYVRKVENFVQNLTQPGEWSRTISADAITLEFFGSFAITDLVLSLESAGTWNQYAVPARKKFSSYINSAPYPVYVADDLVMSGTPQGGRIVEDYWIDELSMTGEPSGLSDLHDSVQSATVWEPESLAQSGDPISGQIIETYFPVYYTMFDIEAIAQIGNPQSGTLIETYFPVYHMVYDIENIAQSGAPISGTLV